MENEPTKETDTAGDKPDKPVEETKESVEEKTPSQKLKEENDALERELIRSQKIRNEALLAGTSGGHVEPKEPVEETPKEYDDRIEKEISEGKHDD